LRDGVFEVRSTAAGLHHKVLPVASEDEAILTKTLDLNDALDGFEKKPVALWTEEEKRKDRKPLSLIQLHLSNNILQEVLQEKSASTLWSKLELICMSKDLTSRLQVKMKLFQRKLQEGQSVMNHLSIFREIVSDLLSMEVKYEDEDLALLLLVSLPSSFMNFRDTICISHDTLTHDGWILDTTYSFHICCNKDWFSSYESVQTGDFVRVENDN
jgi:hypothetical protein